MSIFTKIGKWIADLFSRLKPIVKKAVAIGVEVTDNLKRFDLEHPGAVDLITSLVPGDADDKVVARVRQELPMIMIQLRLVDATLNLTDQQEIVAAGIKLLQQLSGDYRITALNDLAVIIGTVAADGELDINDALFVAKYYKDHYQK